MFLQDLSEVNFLGGQGEEVAVGMFFWIFFFFFKKAAPSDFALIDSFLEHLINFYQQHFSLVCVFFSFVFLSLWELQSIAKPTSSPCSGS